MATVYESFKVVSVSSNTNSFGLHGVIIMSKTGKVFEIGMSAYNKPEKDLIWLAELSDNGNLLSISGKSYEIPRKLATAPANVVREVWKD